MMATVTYLITSTPLRNGVNLIIMSRSPRRSDLAMDLPVFAEKVDLHSGIMASRPD